MVQGLIRGKPSDNANIFAKNNIDKSSKLKSDVR